MNTDKTEQKATKETKPENTLACENCGAVVPNPGRMDGRVICCAACVFNPLGCRCEFGEFGKEETQQFFGGEEDELEDCYG
jgi:hypothetical protein